MLQRIDKLVFYFTIECANCHDIMKVSHVVISEKAGTLFCSLCGKDVTVPNHETLATAAKTLDEYLGDSFNAQYVKLVLNKAFESPSDAPPAH